MTIGRGVIAAVIYRHDEAGGYEGAGGDKDYDAERRFKACRFI